MQTSNGAFQECNTSGASVTTQINYFTFMFPMELCGWKKSVCALTSRTLETNL